MPVLLQYAIDDGEIYLYEVWTNPIRETLELFESITNHKGGICGFNLAFDWFHLNKCYNVFRLCNPEWIPEDHINDIAKVEKQARDGVCLKPIKALDLFLHAKKGEYQSLMDREDIRIKKVPVALAQPLADELHKRIKFNDVYFGRRKVKLKNPWQVFERREGNEVIDYDFRDIVLKFCPSSGLKALAVDVGLVASADILKFEDIAVSSAFSPVEYGWAPFADAVKVGRAWPEVIKYHIDHFAYHKQAREYSRLDIVYTRGLYEFFKRPLAGDDDSELACAVAAVRWKGFAVNCDMLKALKAKAQLLEKSAPKDPGRVKSWIWPDLTDDIKATTLNTAKVTLEALAKLEDDCPVCNGEGTIKGEGTIGNEPCHGGCKDGAIIHKAAIKARQVLKARKAKKEIELYDKLIQAERFHASFKVIGALSGRMSGADKLNPQGIKSTKEVRRCFQLAFDDEVLCGGDFESFEVCIAVADYKDPKLEADLNKFGMCPDCLGGGFKLNKDRTPTTESCLGCQGSGKSKQKLHGLFGMELFHKTYDEVVATKGSSTEKDLYFDAKRGVFAKLYGGTIYTLMKNLGLDEDTATKASEGWEQKYPGIKRAQKVIENKLCTMRQVGGIGSKVTWHDPERYVESMLGFKRYFDLENNICKVLFDLAEDPPKSWLNLKIKVIRRDREQTMAGATRSALFASAFAIQAANVRAAANHRIQSTGAGITKATQRAICDLQPCGVHPWKVRCFQVHDEVMVACNNKETADTVTKVVKAKVEIYKPLIPMISIDWDDLKTWADK